MSTELKPGDRVTCPPSAREGVVHDVGYDRFGPRRSPYREQVATVRFADGYVTTMRAAHFVRVPADVSPVV